MKQYVRPAGSTAKAVTRPSASASRNTIDLPLVDENMKMSMASLRELELTATNAGAAKNTDM
jgi:hypothetical protein